MTPIERGLRRVEAAPIKQAYEVAIGSLVIPAYHRFGSRSPAGWRLFAFFLLVLVLVRLVPAVLRHVLPFSSGLRAYWLGNRVLGKRYDSYQWRKLLWFGVGLTAYAVWAGGATASEAALTATCLAGGIIGEFAWRRRQPPQAAASTPVRVVAGQVPQR